MLASCIARYAIQALILHSRIEAGDSQAQEEKDDVYWSEGSDDDTHIMGPEGFYDG